jgi:hypothetical protein
VTLEGVPKVFIVSLHGCIVFILLYVFVEGVQRGHVGVVVDNGSVLSEH